MAMTAAIMASANSGTLQSFQKLFRQSLLSRSREYEMEDGEKEESDQEELAFFRNLRTLGWIQYTGLLQQPLGEALHGHILKTVRDMIAKEFEEENLYERVQHYKKSVLIPWLEDLVGPQALEADSWSTRLDFSMAECYCESVVKYLQYRPQNIDFVSN